MSSITVKKLVLVNYHENAGDGKDGKMEEVEKSFVSIKFTNLK